MPTTDQITDFKRLAKEAELLGEKHPPEIHCRLCEALPMRVALAALALMPYHDLKTLGERIQKELVGRMHQHG